MRGGAAALLRPAARLLFGRPPAGAAELVRGWSEARTIAVAALSGIGDSVMATPLLSAVRAARPDARLIILVRHDFASLVPIDSGDHLIVSVKTSDRRSLADAARALRRERAGVLLAAQPFNTIKHSVIAIASGSPYRLKTGRDYSGEEWRDFGFLYSALLEDVPGRHRVELNLDLLRACGVEVPEGSVRPRIRVPEPARQEAAPLIAGADGVALVAVHPGGLYAFKQWGSERFAEACRLIAARRPVRFVMVGGGPDLDVCRAIVSATPDLSWIDLAGVTGLATTAAVLERVDLLLSNDTGVMHMATAVDCPVVAVFGETDPRRIGPYHPDARWLRRDPITTISPSEVADLVVERIDAVSASTGS